MNEYLVKSNLGFILLLAAKCLEVRRGRRQARELRAAAFAAGGNIAVGGGEAQRRDGAGIICCPAVPLYFYPLHNIYLHVCLYSYI